MSYALILIPTVCYMGQAVVNLKQRDYPHAMIWFCYALANVGFIWYEVKK
jgi:hypothetical protein